MKVLHCFLFLFTCYLCSAQSYTIEEVNKYPLEADRFIGVDEYDYTYYLKDNALFKRNAENEYQFSALQLGELSSVDLLNPLKITLFYANSNTAVILDNTLSEIRRIAFSALDDFRNVSHATTANDRRLWIYNTDIQQLELFDYNSNKVVVAFPPLEELAKIQSSDFNFCWILSSTTLYWFNNYGTLLFKFPLPRGYSDYKINHLNEIGLSNGKLFYKSNKKDTDSNIDAALLKPLDLPEIPIKQFSLKDEILYIYDGQFLTSFRLKLAKE